MVILRFCAPAAVAVVAGVVSAPAAGASFSLGDVEGFIGATLEWGLLCILAGFAELAGRRLYTAARGLLRPISSEPTRRPDVPALNNHASEVTR